MTGEGSGGFEDCPDDPREELPDELSEESVERYLHQSSKAVDAIQAALERKREAIQSRDYREAYRLAGVASLLCREQERVDREMYLMVANERGAEDG